MPTPTTGAVSASINPLAIWAEVIPDATEPETWELDAFVRQLLLVISDAVMDDPEDARPFSAGEGPTTQSFNAGALASHAWAAGKIRELRVASE